MSEYDEEIIQHYEKMKVAKHLAIKLVVNMICDVLGDPQFDLVDAQTRKILASLADILEELR